MIRSANVSCSILMSKVPNHLSIKQKFLELLNYIPVVGFDDRNAKNYSQEIDSSQKIFNTDFFYSNSRDTGYSNYKNLVIPIFDNHNKLVADFLHYNSPISTLNIWFQQYAKNDYHGWHRHTHCLFSNVYYVDLPSNSSRTTFRHIGSEFELDVEEGMIITFPSFLEHCSKPNSSEYIKTVISFNSN